METNSDWESDFKEADLKDFSFLWSTFCSKDPLDYSMYEISNNPIFVWAGIKLCIDNDYDLPKTFLDYLYDCANNLTQLNIDDGQEATYKAYRAFGLSYKGSGTFFSKFHDYLEQSMVFYMVNKCRESKKPPLSFNKAYKEVKNLLRVNFGKNYETKKIKDMYATHNKYFISYQPNQPKTIIK